jgi:hypothetical protein
MLFIQNSIISVNKHAPRTNEIDSLERFDVRNDLVRTQKLVASSYSDWTLQIAMIKREHFESRERFDTMFLDDPDEQLYDICERISMRKACESMSVKLAANMDFYLSPNHTHELEKDLKRKVTDYDTNLESELFYNQMCDLFGKEDDEDDHLDQKDEKQQQQKDNYSKEYMLKEFHFCSIPNTTVATARRGNFYIGFYYTSS